jgi:serine/threonine protein phosphatase PrpC
MKGLCHSDRQRSAKKKERKNCDSFSIGDNKCKTELKKYCGGNGGGGGSKTLNKTFYINVDKHHNPHNRKINRFDQKEKRLQERIKVYQAENDACTKQLEKMKVLLTGLNRKDCATKNKPQKKSFITTILHHHTLSSAGYDMNQAQKCNQDRITLLPNVIPSSTTFSMAVCDGHGKQGEKISQFVIDYLTNNITSIDFTKNITHISSSLVNLFKSCQHELTNNKAISRKQSGTTVTCAFIINNKVILTNIGDSRCVVYDNHKCEFVFETKAHTLSVREEKERILQCPNAEVTAIVDSESGKAVGPERIFTKGKNGPGIMMTRSIGDVEAHALGVTDEADVDEVDLNEGEYAVIAASDGLWDKVSDKEVCEVVWKYYKSGKVKEMVEELSDAAERKWRDTDDVVDDITIGIVLLKVEREGKSKK